MQYNSLQLYNVCESRLLATIPHLFCRKLAQKWHPDNFQDEDEKKKAEKKFMDIAAAKEVLTDEGELF